MNRILKLQPCDCVFNCFWIIVRAYEEFVWKHVADGKFSEKRFIQKIQFYFFKTIKQFS